ncbi:MAG: hypothetical protein NC916_01975 [Candidatus Omnitrophica bacterium]|nr:hypothetical protein [Candidatus Omnitrophota bacterium]
MKWSTLLLAVLFAGGCVIISQDDGNLKSIGVKKEQAQNLINEIEAQRPGHYKEVIILRAKETPVEEKKIK